jgi:signal transduction histidine kinase/ActR/RegA family two-component response regulator
MKVNESIPSLSNSPAIIRQVGPAELVRMSRAYASEIGFEESELAAKPLLDWIHPEDRDSLRAALETGSGQAHGRHMTASGGWLSLDWEVKTGPDGIALIGLPHLPRPLTNLISPESQLDQAGKLSETLNAMALIVEAKNPGMMCSILLVDKQTQRISGGAGPSLPDAYNKAVEGLLIGPSVGSCGTAAYWNVPVIVEDIQADPLWRDLRDAARIAGVRSCWSYPVTTLRGEVLGAMALYSTVPSTPAEHHLNGLGIAARMVGLAVERDRLEEHLRTGAKMEALGVLAGGIAHDFNNMLAAILGNAELALNALPDHSEANAMLREISTASISASELCNQMLAYAGRGAMTTEEVNCNALFKELGGILGAGLAKKAELRYELSAPDPWVRADRSQMRQVILNLITNASDAIGQAGGIICAGTEARWFTSEDLKELDLGCTLSPGEYVRLWVSDTGQGMSPSVRAKIFDPFFSTKPEGRGLGLAAVQGIVRKHDGAICLNCEVDEGTTFSVLIPRVLAPGECEPAAPDPLPRGDGKRILIADDEPSVRRVQTRILEQVGYEVHAVEDGLEAVELVRAHPDRFDCIILDMSMPKMEGDEAFNEIRQIQKDAKVILTSGFTEKQLAGRLQTDGLAGVLQKPTRLEELVKKVADVMQSGATV